MLSQSKHIEVANINNNNNINNDSHDKSNSSSSNINHGITNKAKVAQLQLVNNETSGQESKRCQRQQQERLHSQADSDQQSTDNGITESKIDREKIWVYFKRSKSDASKLKCLLCSAELCQLSGDKLDRNSSMRSLLWNHLKIEHAIDRDTNEPNSERRRRRQVVFSSSKQNNTNSTLSANNLLSPNTNETNTTTTTTTTTNKSATTITNDYNINTDNMTRTHHHPRSKLMSSRATTKKSPAENNDINDLRRNLDLLEYDDLSKASLKPLPTSSLSKNLFERLNQLSLPVTRRLKFWNKKSFQVNQYDPCFKVIYLGNLGVQFWSKDESCLEKPLNTLWNNYLVNMKTEIVMRLTICNSGLKAITRQHGLTQYWSNRLVYCCSHKNYPKIFAWIYRHEGKKMRQELRCHAVFCSSPERASKMVSLLNHRLTCALEEFKREKKSRGQSSSIVTKSSLSSTGATTMIQTTLPRTVPLRRQILAKGSANFRPPLERSKSAPKLTSIREEDYEIEEEDEDDETVGRDAGVRGDGFGDQQCNVGDEHGSGNDSETGIRDEDDGDDDVSRDEFEYEQSFGDRDDDDGDGDDSNSDFYNDDELGKHDGEYSSNCSSMHKVESNEETSNSSVYATGDISYDNIVANRHLLSTTNERLDNQSTLTAPIILKSSSSLRRSSLRSASLNQNESLNSDRTESMSEGGQHESDSQLASAASSTLNSCHINNTNTPPPPSEHETSGAAVETTNHNSHQANHNTVAHYFGQIKL